MSTNDISLANRVAAPFRAIGALLRDVLLTVEAPQFCCGVQFDRRRPEDEMPTPSSCCGVRL